MKNLYIVFLLLFSMQASAKVRIIGVDPVNKIVVLQNFYSTAVDLSKYMLSFKEFDTNISKLNIIYGTLMCPAKGKVTISGIDMGFDSGYIALHDLRNTSNIWHKQAMLGGDFVQWGSGGHRWESQADSTYYTLYDSTTSQYDTTFYWHKSDYIHSAPPYNFTGGSPDRGVQFWQSYKLPQLGVRLVYIHPSRNEFALKNTGTSGVDVSMLFVCNNTGCSDSLKYISTSKGSPSNIPKGDTIIFNGWPLPDTAGSLAIFFPLNRKDTINLIDFAQWGDSLQPYSDIAHLKQDWDSNSFIHCTPGDSLVYFGNFSASQSGASWWKAAFPFIDTTHTDTTHTDTLGLHIYIPETVFEIYPNPSSGEVNIISNWGGEAKLEVHIYDLLGKMIYNQVLPANQVAMKTHISRTGIYIVELVKPGGMISRKKLIIESH